MSDRSALTLIVYDCPPEQQQAVLDIINEHYLTEDGFHTGSHLGSLQLGEPYYDEECRLDAYAEIAGKLMARAPGATFRVWNDPKYEWLGGLMMYAPGLGAFSKDCDADGNPVFTTEQVLEVAAMAESGYRLQFVGKPWLDRMKVKEPA